MTPSLRSRSSTIRIVWRARHARSGGPAGGVGTAYGTPRAGVHDPGPPPERGHRELVRRPQVQPAVVVGARVPAGGREPEVLGAGALVLTRDLQHGAAARAGTQHQAR